MSDSFDLPDPFGDDYGLAIPELEQKPPPREWVNLTHKVPCYICARGTEHGIRYFKAGGSTEESYIIPVDQWCAHFNGMTPKSEP